MDVFKLRHAERRAQISELRFRLRERIQSPEIRAQEQASFDLLDGGFVDLPVALVC